MGAIICRIINYHKLFLFGGSCCKMHARVCVCVIVCVGTVFCMCMGRQDLDICVCKLAYMCLHTCVCRHTCIHVSTHVRRCKMHLA